MAKHSDITSAFSKVSSILRNDAGENYDMTVQFNGTLHNKQGFQIQVDHVEQLSSSTLNNWSTEALRSGIIIDFTQDFTNGTVHGTCYFINEPIRATCYKCPSWNSRVKWSLLYLSMWIYSTVELCRQHNLVDLL